MARAHGKTLKRVHSSTETQGHRRTRYSILYLLVRIRHVTKTVGQHWELRSYPRCIFFGILKLCWEVYE